MTNLSRLILLVVLLAGCSEPETFNDGDGDTWTKDGNSYRSSREGDHIVLQGYMSTPVPPGGCVEFWHEKTKWQECDSGVYVQVGGLEIDTEYYKSAQPSLPDQMALPSPGPRYIRGKE